MLLCSWAYVSCQYKTHVHFPIRQQKACKAPHSFWKWPWHFPQPRFQAVGLARWGVKLKINEEISLADIWDFEVYWTLVLQWTRKHTCASVLEGGRRETTGWEKKIRASIEAETSDNIQRGWTYLAYVTWQCMSLVMLCHLTSWSRKKHMKNFWKTGSCFCLNTKTHYGLKQIIVYHVHETTLIVLLGLR